MCFIGCTIVQLVEQLTLAAEQDEFSPVVHYMIYKFDAFYCIIMHFIKTYCGKVIFRHYVLFALKCFLCIRSPLNLSVSH